MKSLNRLLLAMLMLLACVNGFAQSRKMDSLENLLKKQIPDSTRIKAINQLIYYYSDSNSNRSLELSRQALSIVDKASSKYQAAAVYLNYALNTETVGLYSESILYNAKALALYQELKDSVSISIIYNNMGIGYNQIGDYSMAVHNLLKAIEIDEARKDTINYCIDYINLSEAYYFSKNYDNAQLWAKKAFNQTLAFRDKSNLPYASETLALAYIELGKLDSAKILIEISAKHGREKNSDYLVSRSYSHLGRVYLKEKNYDSAAAYFIKAIRSSEGKYISDVVLPSLILISDVYLKQGENQKALEHAEEAYLRSVSVKNKVLAMESCAMLANVYEALENESEAIKYLRLASIYKDTILEQSVRGSIQAKAININLENEKRARQQVMLGLAEKEKVLALQRLLLVIGAILLLTLLTMIYLIRKASIERKKTNETLINNNIQLNRLNQEVNGLINTIVHDLKTPLNSMQGILYVLEQDTVHSESATEMIKHGHRVLEGGHEIIKELLELRELEEKASSLNIETVNLKDLVENIRAEYLPYAKQKQIDLKAEVSEAMVGVDQHMIKRMIGNLLSNAIKFSPQGQQVELRAWKNSHVVYFEVVDNGQGFSEADRQKMYQKFQKLSARPTGGESSHGLGLAIVHLLVDRMNASIDLQSEQGKGSTFIIKVPLS